MGTHYIHLAKALQALITHTVCTNIRYDTIHYNDSHETFAQEVTFNEELCKNIASNQVTYVLDICLNCLTEVILTNIQTIRSVRK